MSDILDIFEFGAFCLLQFEHLFDNIKTSKI